MDNSNVRAAPRAIAVQRLTAAKTQVHQDVSGMASLRHAAHRVALLLVSAKQPQILGNYEG